MHAEEVTQPPLLAGFERTPFAQVTENLDQALRVLDLVSENTSELTPHPLVIARAEIRNAQRYLMQMHDGEGTAAPN